MKAKAGAEAQRLRNRQSEPQFDGVVCVGRPCIPAVPSGWAGSALVCPHRFALGRPGGRAGPGVIVVAWWYDPHMPTPFGRSIVGHHVWFVPVAVDFGKS